MKKFLLIVMAVFLLLNTAPLIGCGDFDSDDNGDNNSGVEIPQIDNSVDLKDFTPPADDDNVYVEDETYYTSNSISMVTEIHGNYTVDRPFTLDKDDESKRIYHNIYFYVDDFFQVIYYKNVNDLGQLFVIMSDSADQEYAEIEYTEKGSPLQVNIKKQGVYNLILDTTTFAIDMVKVSDIDVPVYETIKTCELNVHVSASNYSYTPMTLNTATGEYYIEKEIPLNASIGFYSASHMSHYKLSVTPALMDTLLYYNYTSTEQVQIHVGGRYKIYLNAKTYVLRLELQNPDTASYYCQVGWNQGQVLTKASSATPYLFKYNFVAQGKVNDPYVDIPSFYPSLGMSYELSIIDENGYTAYDMYIKESGTYELTINLKDFTLTVDKV